MKRFDLYRRREPCVNALHWTQDVTVADLNDFCDGLVNADDVNSRFELYDMRLRRWVPFKYGDWIVYDDGLTPMSHDEFVRTYEKVSDASEDA